MVSDLLTHLLDYSHHIVRCLKMPELGFLIGLAHAIAAFTYVLGVLFQTLPLTKAEIKAWGPTMMWDAVIAEVAIGLVYAVQTAVSYLSSLIQTSFDIPLDPSISYGLILAQLTSMDATIILLISSLSATVVLAPVAELLSRMLGSVASWVTNAIIFWTVIYTLINVIPVIWLVLYEIGIVFFALPLRLGRRLGSYFMGGSIVSAVSLPVLPSLALKLEANLGYELALKQFQDAINSALTNPLAIVSLPAAVPALISGIMQAIVIALIIFPISYMFAVSVIAKSLSSALGGSSGGKFILIPSGG